MQIRILWFQVTMTPVPRSRPTTTSRRRVSSTSSQAFEPVPSQADQPTSSKNRPSESPRTTRREAAASCPVSHFRFVFSKGNSGTFQVSESNDREFQRTRERSRGSPEHSPSSPPRDSSQPHSRERQRESSIDTAVGTLAAKGSRCLSALFVATRLPGLCFA